ncbi:hypothetical protein [Luteolibacter marinus]|uniref:hypothetical protein n=1 Tax=Luteolibacter marinus TaxID=2776705 RepID=UPI0018660B0B|nr:hypothetical protein [Luteolibacter marinus]
MDLFPEPGAPLVIPTQGYTPNCWENRSVIFVANLLSMFFGNREEAEILEDEISCVDSYGGRLLPVLGLIFGGGDNVLVLERKPDPALSDYFSGLGLDLPEIEILPRRDFLALGQHLANGTAAGHPLLDRLLVQPAGIIDGFVTDETIDRLATTLGKRTLSSPTGSHRGNNKLLLHRHLESSGLPVFPTIYAGSRREIPGALGRFRAMGYQSAVIKAQVGASGIGLIKLPTDKPVAAIPSSFWYEGPVMVQAWLQAGEHGITSALSPSVQVFVHDDAVYLYDLTEQILDDSIHQGNESPPPYLDDFPGLLRELLRQAGVAASWLHQQGYRGAASVDFLLACHAERPPVVYVCEINARVTGATYPSVLARHFHPRGAWRMRNLELVESLPGETLLEKLGRHSELFSTGRRAGILPVNFNLDPDGRVRKGQFLAIADTIAECRQLMDTARHDLPVEWDYTKDR